MRVLSKLLAVLLLALAIPAQAAITHFASATNPADNAVLTDAAARSLTPPASMSAGDLVFVEVIVRLSNETITLSNSGGQAWNTLTNRAVGSVTSRKFWTVFNGTWPADPSWESANKLGGAMTIAMSVYRPTSASYVWVVDQSDSFASYSAQTTITITGQTPVAASTVTIADWISDGDGNTFSSLTGGWTNPLATAQIRSTQGTGTSFARAHLIQSTAAATGNVSLTASSSTNGHKSIITFKETLAVAWTVAPNVTSTSTTGYTIGFTAAAGGDVYCVAVPKGSSAPSATQVQNGQNAAGAAALASVTKTVTTSADSVTLTGVDVPTTDLHCIIRVAAVNSAVTSILDQFKQPAASVLYDDLGSIGTGTYCEPISSPAVAAGDVVEIDRTTTPSGATVSVYGTCHLSYPGNTSRQLLCYRIYDDSAQAFMSLTGSPQCSGTRAALWFNDPPPLFDVPSDSIVVDVGSAMTPIDLCARATHVYGDVLTGALTGGSWPTGLALGGTGNCTLSGTASVESETGVTVTFTVTDYAGATADLDLTIYPLDTLTVPNCVNTSVGDCINALQATFLDAGVISFSYSVSIPAGNVISQSPAAATEQQEGTAVDLVVSRGSPGGGRNRLRLQLRLP